MEKENREVINTKITKNDLIPEWIKLLKKALEEKIKNETPK